MAEIPQNQQEPLSDLQHTEEPRTIQDALHDLQDLLGIAEGEGEGLEITDPQRFNLAKSKDLAHEAMALQAELEDLMRQRKEVAANDPELQANIELVQGSLDELLREQEENPPE